MRINYFSDIHLEFGPLLAPSINADIIVAAGDLGIGTQGAEWLQTLDKPVIYVAGNHEFYKHDYLEALAEIRTLCADSNVVFLENECFVFQDVRFLGCTLWADLFADGDDKAGALSKTLNDFRRIRYGDGEFNVERFTALYHKSKAWLERELAKPFSGKTVVVTHHAPSQWSWNDSAFALKKLAYCNDLKPLMHEYEIAAWFHGHVHSVADYRIAGAQILCNPRGYLGKKTVSGFNRNKVVEI